ncbi:MAG: hypothetical protein NVSMB27_24580 [Ktedonobacteraceae bacterium]
MGLIISAEQYQQEEQFTHAVATRNAQLTATSSARSMFLDSVHRYVLAVVRAAIWPVIRFLTKRDNRVISDGLERQLRTQSKRKEYPRKALFPPSLTWPGVYLHKVGVSVR